jgi:small neutral amino acid transporter SnatA (MarC family)
VLGILLGGLAVQFVFDGLPGVYSIACKTPAAPV